MRNGQKNEQSTIIEIEKKYAEDHFGDENSVEAKVAEHVVLVPGAQNSHTEKHD